MKDGNCKCGLNTQWNDWLYGALVNMENDGFKEGKNSVVLECPNCKTDIKVSVHIELEDKDKK